MFRAVAVACFAACMTFGPLAAADERPLDHIGAVIDTLQNELDKHSGQPPSPTRKVQVIDQSCDFISKDEKQASYLCNLTITYGDASSSLPKMKARLPLVHDLTSDTWSSAIPGSNTGSGDNPEAHLDMAIDALKREFGVGPTNDPFKTPKRLSISEKSCTPRGKDAKQAVFDCRIAFTVSDTLSAPFSNLMQVRLIHTYANNAWEMQER